MSVNLKYQFILYKNKESLDQQCRSDNGATILFFILALKNKLQRGFMIAYLHYADNYQSKILAMFYHQNEMIYEHFSGI